LYPLELFPVSRLMPPWTIVPPQSHVFLGSPQLTFFSVLSIMDCPPSFSFFVYHTVMFSWIATLSLSCCRTRNHGRRHWDPDWRVVNLLYLLPSMFLSYFPGFRRIDGPPHTRFSPPCGPSFFIQSPRNYSQASLIFFWVVFFLDPCLF